MKKIRLKKSRKRRLNYAIIKFFFFVIIIIISIVLTIKYLINNSKNITKDEYLTYLLNKSYDKSSDNFIIKEGIKLFSGIDLKKPETLISNKLKLALRDKSYDSVEDLGAGEDNYSTDIYDKVTSFIENNQKQIQNPILYLYNSHQLETYSNEGLDSDISPNVLMVTYLLSEKLNKNKIPTIVEDTNISEFNKISNLPSDSFYTSTRIFLKNTMNKYPTVKYFIDLHRDSVNRNISTRNINNKNYARILFVLGTTNKNYKENESIMEKLNTIAGKYYPGLSRGIYKRQTPNWPDSYNQDLNKGVLLIEVGGKENTLDEISNTIDALCDIITKYIEGI